MPIQNADIAEIFRRMANLLEIEGANTFRVRAYRNAARTISSLGRQTADMLETGEKLSELPGIGDDLAAKIREIVETGELQQLAELEDRVPAELDDLMAVEGLGPKRVKALHQHLGIKNLDELKKAAENRQIRSLQGFGQKTEASILDWLSRERQDENRISLSEAEQRAEPLTEYLKGCKRVQKITIAGSYRRRRETVGDLDILLTCMSDTDVMERFTNYEDVQKIVSKGDTRSTVVLKSGLQVDLRVLPEAAYGAGLHYFTGSKAHNIAVRKRAVKKNLKINEYGVFKGEKRIAGKTEKEVFKAVDLPYIPPELREDRGEIEAAEQNRLPDLIAPEKIRGDLHSHTRESDGRNGLEEMVRAAQKLGYEYLAVTDHSQKVTMANGLDVDRLAKQIERIDRLNETLDNFRVLKGIEVDILEDGTLDLPNEILKELDIRVCAVHYNFRLTRSKQTQRILKALENPYCNILAHPTGRIIGKRQGYEIDLEKIMHAARQNGCFMELNADPERLDLADAQCQIAKHMGIRIAVSTDAHNIGALRNMRFGIAQARRGWLSAEDVINTYPCEKLLDLFRV